MKIILNCKHSFESDVDYELGDRMRCPDCPADATVRYVVRWEQS